MSLYYKFNQSTPEAISITFHEGSGYVHNVTFAAANGMKLFLNYAYLVWVTYAPEEDAITLKFMTHLVTLKGHRLAGLFDRLMTQAPRQIEAVAERHAATMETGSVVTHIAVDVL